PQPERERLTGVDGTVTAEIEAPQRDLVSVMAELGARCTGVETLSGVGTFQPGQAGAQSHARVLGDDGDLAHTTQGTGPGQCHGRCERARPLVTGLREAGDDPPRRQGPRYPHRNLCP